MSVFYAIFANSTQAVAGPEGVGLQPVAGGSRMLFLFPKPFIYMIIKMNFLKTLMLGAMLAASVATQAKSKMTAYLFAYFTGNEPEKEQIHFAYSRNGFDFTPLNNGRPIIGSDSIALMKGVRDPHILRGHDGCFYMVVTDMRSSLGWASNRGIVLMRSKDMVNWTHHTVNFPTKYAGTNLANVTRVWAPQTIYDEKAGKYLVYFSLLTNDGTIPYDRVYCAYANKDFTDLETMPEIFFDYGQAAIDTDIALDANGTYHIFFKTEGGEQKGLKQYVARDLRDHHSWKLLGGYCQDTHHAVEGSGVFPLIEGGWCLMYDCYMAGFYQFCKSDDLLFFKAVKNTETHGAFTPRHGTIIQISDKELKRLKKAFPNTK